MRYLALIAVLTLCSCVQGGGSDQSQSSRDPLFSVFTEVTVTTLKYDLTLSDYGTTTTKLIDSGSGVTYSCTAIIAGTTAAGTIDQKCCYDITTTAPTCLPSDPVVAALHLEYGIFSGYFGLYSSALNEQYY